MNKLLRLSSSFVGLCLAFGLFVLIFIIYISFDLPRINSLADYNPPVPSKVYSQDGVLLMELGTQKREVIPFDQVPKRVVDAFLSAEDDNFYHHSGVDYTGIARAMIKNIQAGRIVQGASTITQQVAKSLLLTSERTFTRKIKDLLLAKRIEEKFSKNEILYLYLNQVYLGGSYYGVKSAFEGYFGKELSEATIAESALIAGLLVAPTKYSPYTNPKYAKARQKYVLGRMFKTGKITEDEYLKALEEEIIIKRRVMVEPKARYFTDWVRQRLMKKFGAQEILEGGFEVVTTIDYRLQKKAEEEILKGAIEIDKRQGYKGPKLRVEIAEREDFYRKVRKSILSNIDEEFTFKTDGTKIGI